MFDVFQLMLVAMAVAMPYPAEEEAPLAVDSAVPADAPSAPLAEGEKVDERHHYRPSYGSSQGS